MSMPMSEPAKPTGQAHITPLIDAPCDLYPKRDNAFTDKIFAWIAVLCQGALIVVVWLSGAVSPATALDPTKSATSFLDNPKTTANAVIEALPKAPLLFAQTQSASPTIAPPQDIVSPQQALVAALQAMPTRDPLMSVDALKYAADNGQPMAQWRLGRMYAIGERVNQDDAKAYDYFSRIVDGYDEESADNTDLALVSNAFVAIGVYNLNGVASANIKPDINRAIMMFKYAASNFGNPDAQYNLARIYLDGVGVPRDLVQAAKWLRLAAEKNHVQAQAVLGNLLFFGGEGLGRQRARGLMWLMLAKKMVANNQDHWIITLCNTIEQQASENDRQVASLYVDERQKHGN